MGSCCIDEETDEVFATNQAYVTDNEVCLPMEVIFSHEVPQRTNDMGWENRVSQTGSESVITGCHGT